MKKFLTFLMVAAMLVSMLALTVSAEQTNMEVTIPKFSKQPTFDGCVTEEEWGAKTIRVVTDGAATTDDDEVGVNEELGLKNTFYYFTVEGTCDTLAYDMWLRWDADFLYIAAIVDDPDPFSLPKGGEEIWNGDCVQIRVDEAGPNGVMLNSNPNYDYKTEEFNGNRFKTPWSKPNEVFNGIMGMVKGDTPTFWRCGKTYGEGWNLVTTDGALVGATLVENDDGTCKITYEGAIPWAAVNATLIPKEGDVYGIGVAVACSDSNVLNGMLQWGSGIMFADEQPRGTRGGSQAMILGAEEVTPADGYDVATTAPETEAPEEDSPLLNPGNNNNNNNDANADATVDANDDDANDDANVNDDDANDDADKDEGGLNPVIIAVIAAAVVVVAAVVVIIIVKKKKN